MRAAPRHPAARVPSVAMPSPRIDSTRRAFLVNNTFPCRNPSIRHRLCLPTLEAPVGSASHNRKSSLRPYPHRDRRRASRRGDATQPTKKNTDTEENASGTRGLANPTARALTKSRSGNSGCGNGTVRRRDLVFRKKRFAIGKKIVHDQQPHNPAGKGFIVFDAHGTDGPRAQAGCGRRRGTRSRSIARSRPTQRRAVA